MNKVLAKSRNQVSWESKAAAEYQRPSGLTESARTPHMLGSSILLKKCLSPSTGETTMEKITSPGTKISTFHSTVDHAGLKEPLQPLLTGSTS